MLLRRMSWFGRVGVAKAFLHGVDVSWHCCATCAFVVASRNIYSGELGPCPISCDSVMLLECSEEVLGVSFPNVFNSKIVNNEHKGGGLPFVSPKS